MALKITLALIFILSLAGATLEGVWAAAPAPLIQLNGLMLLLSALAIGALTLSGGSMPTSAPHSEGS